MSGITAIIHFDGTPIEPDQLEQLVSAIAWRGLDDYGSWINETVGFGSVQLWTTPEEWDSHQPFTTPQGDAAVLDGRIDNRAEVGRQLNIHEHELTAMTDVELFWVAYKKWAQACVDYIAGAYAVIIWDAHKRELFCGRDPLGLRSLFYHWNGRRFYVASTIQALRYLEIFPTTLNDEYMWDYLSTSFSSSFDLEATPFQEIKRLPGGHFLSLTENGISVTRYWKPWELPAIAYKQSIEYADHLKHLFEEVMVAHCRSAGPIGVALSGGLDSSSIVGIAHQMENAGRLPATDMHTFTMVWKNASQSLTSFTDGDYAEIVNKQFGSTSHYLVCDGLTMFDQIPHRGSVPQDEPNFHIFAPWLHMGKKINQTGVRVLLSGAGADDGMSSSLFCIVDWLMQGRVKMALQAVKRVAENGNQNYAHVLFNLILSGLGPRSLAYHIHERQPKHSLLGLNTRFHTRTVPWLPNQDQLIKRSLARHRFIPKNFKNIADQAQFEVSIMLAGDNTKLWSDQYLALPAHIDQRAPFYDRRLIEFFLRIPTIQKMGRSGERKMVMRRAMEKTLPDTIRFRQGNTDYGFTLLDGLRLHWRSIQEMFKNSRAADAGYIDGAAFLKVLSDRRYGSGNVTDADIFPTLGLEFWLHELENPIKIQGLQKAYISD
ncbi:MAG: asparagine synthase-related protein [Chloroflexota bacterium]